MEKTISQKQINQIEEVIFKIVDEQGYCKDQYETACDWVAGWLMDYMECSIEEIESDRFDKALELLKKYPRKG